MYAEFFLHNFHVSDVSLCCNLLRKSYETQNPFIECKNLLPPASTFLKTSKFEKFLISRS